MRITLHYKLAEINSISYEMELEEFKRLASDFAGYLREGFPTDGSYLGTTVFGDPALKTFKPILIKFEDISLIS